MNSKIATGNTTDGLLLPNINRRFGRGPCMLVLFWALQAMAALLGPEDKQNFGETRDAITEIRQEVEVEAVRRGMLVRAAMEGGHGSIDMERLLEEFSRKLKEIGERRGSPFSLLQLKVEAFFNIKEILAAYDFAHFFTACRAAVSIGNMAFSTPRRVRSSVSYAGGASTVLAFAVGHGGGDGLYDISESVRELYWLWLKDAQTMRRKYRRAIAAFEESFGPVPESEKARKYAGFVNNMSSDLQVDDVGDYRFCKRLEGPIKALIEGEMSGASAKATLDLLKMNMDEVDEYHEKILDAFSSHTEVPVK